MGGFYHDRLACGLCVAHMFCYINPKMIRQAIDVLNTASVAQKRTKAPKGNFGNKNILW